MIWGTNALIREVLGSQIGKSRLAFANSRITHTKIAKAKCGPQAADCRFLGYIIRMRTSTRYLHFFTLTNFLLKTQYLSSFTVIVTRTNHDLVGWSINNISDVQFNDARFQSRQQTEFPEWYFHSLCWYLHQNLINKSRYFHLFSGIHSILRNITSAADITSSNNWVTNQ